MAKTARFLSKRVQNKTIVLTGSMVPYKYEDSDALFNLGSSINSVQLLPAGVYICMHGKVFGAENVKKDAKKMEFVEI